MENQAFPGLDAGERGVSEEVKVSAKDADDKPDSRPSEVVDPTRYGDWEKNGRCIDF